MDKKHYHIVADLDYIQGHLQYGHLEGRVDLTDEELTQLKNDRQFAKWLGLSVEVDYYRIDNVGEVNSLTVFEVDESGTTLKEIEMPNN